MKPLDNVVSGRFPLNSEAQNILAVHNRVIDVKELRARLNLSQRLFARTYGFKFTSLRDWEQGRSEPTGHNKILLVLIAADPVGVSRILTKVAQSRGFDYYGDVLW